MYVFSFSETTKIWWNEMNKLKFINKTKSYYPTCSHIQSDHYILWQRIQKEIKLFFFDWQKNMTWKGPRQIIKSVKKLHKKNLHRPLIVIRNSFSRHSYKAKSVRFNTKKSCFQLLVVHMTSETVILEWEWFLITYLSLVVIHQNQLGILHLQ